MIYLHTSWRGAVGYFYIRIRIRIELIFQLLSRSQEENIR